jgi:hypothetical protein
VHGLNLKSELAEQGSEAIALETAVIDRKNCFHGVLALRCLNLLRLLGVIEYFVLCRAGRVGQKVAHVFVISDGFG